MHDDPKRERLQRTIGRHMRLFGQKKINTAMSSIVLKNVMDRQTFSDRFKRSRRDDSSPDLFRHPVNMQMPFMPDEPEQRPQHPLAAKAKPKKEEALPPERRPPFRSGASQEIGENWIPHSVSLLSDRLQDMFSRFLGIRLPRVFVHRNVEADVYLRQRRADAMTLGSDVYFREGAFDPASKRGLGLLGHELTHVAQNAGMRGTLSAGPASSDSDEYAALANERFLQEHVSTSGIRYDSGMRGTIAQASQTGALQPAAAPRFAETGRQAGPLPSLPPGDAGSGVLSEHELTRIKEAVYRDLIMRIKVDFERGA